jgi:hypothetical protein
MARKRQLTRLEFANPDAAECLFVALREVMRFRRGEGKYNLSRVPERDRELAYIESWEAVENMIAPALTRAATREIVE